MIRLLVVAGRGLLIGGLLLGIVLLLMFGTASLDIWFFLPLLTGAATGLVLSVRRPGNALGWVFLAFGSIGLLSGGSTAAAADLVHSGSGHLEALAWAYWLSQTTWIPVIALASVFPLLLFPDGLQSRRWKPVLWLAVIATSVATLMFAFVPRLTDAALGISMDNPFAPSWLDWMSQDPGSSLAANVALLTFLGCLGVAAVGLALRFRRASGVERQQLRWFALAALLVALAFAMDRLLGDWYADSRFADAFLPVTLAFLPVACGVAIMRYGLYEIDRILSRTLSYVLVTGVVLATYALVVTSVSSLLPGSNTLAVAGATLASAAVFRPVLRHVRDRVDRRFNRGRFHAELEVETFSARMRELVDPGAVEADLRDVALRTLQPKAVGLWTNGVHR